jgi:hypothetical protein
VRGPAGRISVDDTYLPVLLLDLEEDHGADVSWMLGEYERIFSLGQRYALLGNALKVTRPLDAHGRSEIARWLLANRKNLERYCVGSALVFRSAFVRGAMTALYWIAPAPMPMYYPQTMEEAARWCVDRLEASGVSVSHDARRVIAHAQATGPRAPRST